MRPGWAICGVQAWALNSSGARYAALIDSETDSDAAIGISLRQECSGRSYPVGRNAIRCCYDLLLNVEDRGTGFPFVPVSVWLTRCAARCISICSRNFTCEDLASLVHPWGKGHTDRNLGGGPNT